MEKDLYFFNLLKKEVISRFREDFSYVPQNPKDWKLTHISYFQESLFKATKGNFSDRWFYTYFKNTPTKLPRIDMLNILSNYVGYDNWEDFKHQNEKIVEESFERKATPDAIETSDVSENENIQKKRRYNLFLKLVGVLLVLFLIIFLFWNDNRKHTYQLYFKDNDRGAMMKDISVYIPQNTDNPKLTSDDEGKIEVFSREDTLHLYIESMYYKKDTFDLVLSRSDGVEVIELTPDYYSQMMYFYSHSKDTEVEKRRKKLEELISNDAVIYQVYDNENYGLEELTKEQYINLITGPTQSLKNFELINSINSDGKVVLIKFKIKPNEASK